MDSFHVSVSQVTAHDRDGSRVVYTGIMGDQAMVESLELDPATGEITITDNSHLDRETKDSECWHIFNVRQFPKCSLCSLCPPGRGS